MTTLPEYYDALSAAVLDVCRDHYSDRLVSLAVFGSVGRGCAHPGSDLDFLLVADGLPRGRLKRMAEFGSAETRIEAWLRDHWRDGEKPCLSPIIRQRSEIEAGSPLLLDMTQDARILYDKGGFLAARLARLSARLRELGARRIVRGNAWWWDLKPDYKVGEVFSL